MEPSERIARLIGLIDESGRVVLCPTCGENAWDYGLATLNIPVDPQFAEMGKFEVFPLICTHCGYVRMHSTHHLERKSQRHSD